MDLFAGRRSNIVGGFLFCAGLLTDIALGIFWLSGAGPHLWLWHIPVVLFWSVGVNLFCAQSRCGSEIKGLSRLGGK